MELVGTDIVNQVLRMNCEPTNRVMDNLVEFAAYLCLPSGERLSAFYYQTLEDFNEVEDLDYLNWEVDHFTIY